jgi:hypothetical protein
MSVLVVLLAAITASASSLWVDGGSIQVFDPPVPTVIIPTPVEEGSETDDENGDSQSVVSDSSDTNAPSE